MPVNFDSQELDRIQAEGDLISLKRYASDTNPWLAQYQKFLVPVQQDITEVLQKHQRPIETAAKLYNMRNYTGLLRDASALISRVVAQVDELHQLEINALSAALGSQMALERAKMHFKLAEIDDRHDSISQHSNALKEMVSRYGSESKLRSEELVSQANLYGDEANRSEVKKVLHQEIFEKEIKVQQILLQQMSVTGSGFNYSQRYNTLRAILIRDFEEAYLKSLAAYIGCVSIFEETANSVSDDIWAKMEILAQAPGANGKGRLPRFPSRLADGQEYIYELFGWITSVMRTVDFIHSKEVPFCVSVEIFGISHHGYNQSHLPRAKFYRNKEMILKDAIIEFSLEEIFSKHICVRLREFAITTHDHDHAPSMEGIQVLKGVVDLPGQRVPRINLESGSVEGFDEHGYKCEAIDLDIPMGDHNPLGLQWMTFEGLTNCDPANGRWKIALDGSYYNEKGAIPNTQTALTQQLLSQGLVLHLRGVALRKTL